MKKYKLTLIAVSMLVILRAISLIGDIDKLIRLYRTDPPSETDAIDTENVVEA